MKIEFIPKAGGEPWTAYLSAELHGDNGFDVILMLDKVAKTDDSGWMLELAIERSGAVSGQITAHPGYDALALFECAQNQMTIQPNAVGPVFTIHEQQPAVDPLAEAIRALRLIYAGSSEEGRWLDNDDGAVDGAYADGPPEGCYDIEDAPECYNDDGWCGDPGLKPPMPLVPVRWEKFTAEEQKSWLDSCAWHAKAALEKIGVPLVEL